MTRRLHLSTATLAATITALTGLITAGVTAGVPVARAEPGDLIEADRLLLPIGAHVLVGMPSDLRLMYGRAEGIALESADPTVPDRAETDSYGQMRFRLRPALLLHGRDWPLFQVYKLGADVDARTYIGGTAPTYLQHDPDRQLRVDWEGVRLTQATLLAAGERVAIKAGLMRSSWGLGMLANPGEDPTAGAIASPFGFARYADRVIRFALSFFPVEPQRLRASPRSPRPLTVTVAGDMVLEDSNANWDDGDRTYHLIGAVLGHVSRFTGGLYAVYRHQAHHEGGSTEVSILDITARYDLLRGPVDVWVETEAAMVLGSTSFSRSVTRPGRFDIFSTGAILRAAARTEGFEAAIEGGVASGDDNPFDSQLGTFSFHRDYRVGLMLFGEALKASTAVGAHSLTDQTYRAEPPRGFDRLANGGAVQGVVYINPRFAIRPVPELTLMMGVVYAATTADYADPFKSSVAGGQAVGPNGAKNETDLGWEFDVGVQLEIPIDRFKLRLRAEMGWLAPGAVFDSASGESAPGMTGYWLRLEALL